MLLYTCQEKDRMRKENENNRIQTKLNKSLLTKPCKFCCDLNSIINMSFEDD